MNYGRRDERKQWLPHRGRLSLTISWLENVSEGALGLSAMKKRGASMLCVAEEVAREMNVDIDY